MGRLDFGKERFVFGSGRMISPARLPKRSRIPTAQGVRSAVVTVEFQNGTLNLIPTAQGGAIVFANPT